MEAPSPSHYELNLSADRYCIFKPTEETNAEGWRKHRCSRCGYVSVFIPPWSQRIVRQCRYLGLGDYVAHGLASFGITKERVAWVRGLFGAEPGCGGCPERQEALNEVGKKIGL